MYRVAMSRAYVDLVAVELTLAHLIPCVERRQFRSRIWRGQARGQTPVPGEALPPGAAA